jgi:hypothetical protein
MKKSLIITALVGLGGIAYADSPIQLSLTPDIAVCPRTEMINGFSLNIWGENPQMGLNLGLVNGSTGDSGGFSAAVVNYDENYSGVHWAVVNTSSQSFLGWQCGAVNISRGTFQGFQSGIVNLGDETSGVQVGLVNYAGNLRGVQLGLANFASNNPMFDAFPDQLATGFPFFNWSF